MSNPQKITVKLASPAYVRDWRPVPFWSWNDKLDKNRLVKQIEWMNSCGIGGFFMHARGGLITEYLGKEWMECCDACCDKAVELDMDAYMYDENGWPSGFAGGKLLEDENNRDQTVYCTAGELDSDSFVSYKIEKDRLVRTDKAESGAHYLNIYRKTAVSTVDVLNPEVVDKFLDLTHRAYKKRYGKEFSKKIKGFFTDEPQYFRWDTPYTPMIAKYFKEVYNEDVLDGIGLLFAEKQGYEEFRHKYWTGMQRLFLENFGKKIYDFCEENKIAFTGHYIEESSLGGQMLCCGGIMPFYQYEHIPGIDWLGRGISSEIMPKQVGSVAAQTGRNRVLTESFACCGWDVTPRELKKILEWQYLGGVNLLCHHLLPSSEYGQRKRDYPQHYTPLNPWIKHSFKDFNDCFTRLGALIGNSKELVNVGMLHPVKSAYIDYDRTKDWANLKPMEDAFTKESEYIAGLHIPHHYLDETVLESIGKVKDSEIICGECRYKYLIIPSVKNITANTYCLLKEFIIGGGKLLMLGKAPEYLDGKKHEFPEIQSNCTIDEIKAAQPYSIDNNLIRSSLRVCDGEEFVFALNHTDEEQTFTLAVPQAKSCRILDMANLSISDPLPLKRTLRPGQSALLFPSQDAPVRETEKHTVALKGSQRAVNVTDNTFMLDCARYKKEGGDYGENTPLIKIFAQLLDERYKGELQLKYEFTSNVTPENLKLYAEDMNTLKVEINGKESHKIGVHEYEPKLQIFDAAPYIIKGKNDIVITLNYYQDENVYYALFGEGVTESLRNCMVYNTALESIYLAGDFGVYPVGLRSGQTERTVLCDGFILDEKKAEINDFIKDGYAMFAGEITLESEIDFPSGDCLLEIGGRWQTAIVEINGIRKKLLFDTAIDVSDMIHPGKNTVRITLTTSLRNLMGPHHFAPADESTAVSPDTFELTGTWKNGESPRFRASYSLVRTSF